MDSIYDHPHLYEIAYSFRDIPAEVDVLEDAAKRFSRIPVTRFLEIGCGNSPHLDALACRGYAYTGLDINDRMLAFSRKKALAAGIQGDFIKADMIEFTIDEPADFAFVMLGSLYLEKREDLRSHFDSIAGALRPGGLYFLDWCITFDYREDEQSWTIERDKVALHVTFASTILDRVEQIFEDVETYAFVTDGETRSYESRSVRRVIFPQEFLLFLSTRKDFEFVGWWNDWDFAQPLGRDMKINRPIAVVRRT